MLDSMRLRPLALALTFATLPMTASGAFVTTEIGGSNDPNSILPTVNAFRAQLGDPSNGNAAGPLLTGRREINWDGGGNNNATAVAGTPFNGFLAIRGASFETTGTALCRRHRAG